MLTDRLERLAADHGAWSQATFGSDAAKGPVGALRHLAKEAVEAEQDAITLAEMAGGCGTRAARNNLGTELGDCLLLLLDANRRSGFTVDQLLGAAEAKMVVNKARTWPAPVGDEPVEHVRDAGA